MPSPASFEPAWWCRNRHLQTVWGMLFRNDRLALRRERVETPDGDFLDLDWGDGLPGAPLLLVLHGLEGSAARSHYVSGLLRAATTRGWRGVALNFRACGGEPNRLPRFYHAGETGDLDWVVRRLTARDPASAIVAVGVSLGGNVLVKWLGERGDDVPPQIAGAVGISVPFDLASCVGVMDQGFRRVVYTANFLRSFRQKIRRKAPLLRAQIDLEAALRARTFAAYDRAATAPLHGFRDERDYWARASSGPFLPRVRRPLLLIAARDDPFVPASILPDPAAVPAGVRVEYVPIGGHAGFVEGRWPWRARWWAEGRAVEFLAGLVPIDTRTPAAEPAVAGETAALRRPPGQVGVPSASLREP